MRSRTVAFATALAASGCGGTASTTAHPPPLPRLTHAASTTTLANGLTVIVDEDRSVSNVAVAVAYHVGAKDDPEGRSGLAHLVEHAAFAGSLHAPARTEVFERLEGAGASDVNATTTYDLSMFWEVLPPSEIGLALWIESERMGFPLTPLPDDRLASEKSIVTDEDVERREASELGRLTPIVYGAFFPAGHPYHRALAGTPEDVAAASARDVAAFRARYYVPRNACLSIVGPIAAADGIALARRWFETIPSPPPPSSLPPPPTPNAAGAAPPAGERRVAVDAAVDHDALLVVWAAPPGSDPEASAVEIALRDLAGQMDARNVFDGANAELTTVREHYVSQEITSLAVLELTLRSPALASEVLARLDHLVSDDPRARAATDRTRFDIRHEAASLFYADESPLARATAFASAQVELGRWDFFRAKIDAYRALSPDAVAAARTRYLGTKNRLVVRIHHDPTAPRGGRVAPRDQPW